MSANERGQTAASRLAASLCDYEGMDREASDWNLMAQGIIAQVRSGRLGPTEREERLEAALREVEFGNSNYDDIGPLCGRLRRDGHLSWCRIGLALVPPSGETADAEE